jgi:hypothetical protein
MLFVGVALSFRLAVVEMRRPKNGRANSSLPRHPRFIESGVK